MKDNDHPSKLPLSKFCTIWYFGIYIYIYSVYYCNVAGASKNEKM